MLLIGARIRGREARLFDQVGSHVGGTNAAAVPVPAGEHPSKCGCAFEERRKRRVVPAVRKAVIVHDLDDDAWRRLFVSSGRLPRRR